AIDEAIVWQALEQLRKARLLREPFALPTGAARITRRQALRRLGKTAALALLVPAVTTIIAPTPVRAADCNMPPCKNSCKDQCTTNNDCPRGNLFGVLVSCTATNCTGCSQRRCRKTASG